MLQSMFIAIFRQVKIKEIKEKNNSKYVIQHSNVTGISTTFLSAKTEYQDL